MHPGTSLDIYIYISLLIILYHRSSTKNVKRLFVIPRAFPHMHLYSRFFLLYTLIARNNPSNGFVFWHHLIVWTAIYPSNLRHHFSSVCVRRPRGNKVQGNIPHTKTIFAAYLCFYTFLILPFFFITYS